MKRFKSKAVFPQHEIMNLIARWKAIDAAEKMTALMPEQIDWKHELMRRIAEKATPVFIAFAIFENHPRPMKFAELCRGHMPRWVAALPLDKVHQVFAFLSIRTCEVMRQIQAEEAKR